MKPIKPLHVDEAPHIVKLIRKARWAKETGHATQFSELCKQLFAIHNARLMTSGASIVDTFWDIKTQSFITHTRNGGREVFDPVFSTKAGAPVAHMVALFSILAWYSPTHTPLKCL